MRPHKLVVAAPMAALALAAVFLALWLQAERRVGIAERRALPAGAARTLLDDLETAELKKLGLADPPNDLRSDLAAHGELIPFEGVVGGTMNFYDRAGIVLLPGGYVYAQGDDGHILVHAVLSYQVATGGKITWKLLDARPD